MPTGVRFSPNFHSLPVSLPDPVSQPERQSIGNSNCEYPIPPATPVEIESIYGRHQPNLCPCRLSLETSVAQENFRVPLDKNEGVVKARFS
jgi:hypothetical protein